MGAESELWPVSQSVRWGDVTQKASWAVESDGLALNDGCLCELCVTCAGG